MSEPRLRVIEASRDELPLLDHLLELYAYDFSDMLGLELGAGGRYFADGFPHDADNDRAWLLYAGQRPAGFAIATRGSVIDGRADVWDMHEFFVVRRHRRAGAGQHLARTVFQHQPGTWEVRVIPANLPALAFWRRAIETAAGRTVEPELAVNRRTGKAEHVFRLALGDGHAGQTG